MDSTTGALAILAVGACTVTVTAAATDNYKAATATFGVAVNAAGALRLSVDAVAGDNTVNSAEKTAGFSIEGNTGAEADVTVTVTLGTQTFNAVTSATAAGATAATWSVPVPGGSTYVTGTTLALTVAAAKTGYTAPAAVSRTVAVDLTAPTAPAYTAPSALTVGEAITALFPAGGSDIAASNGYSAAGLPAGLAIGATSGVIAGAPTTAAGAATATVTVRDGAGNTDTVAIDFPAVARGAQDLSGFNYTPASLNYGAPTPTLGAPTVADSAALSYTSTSTGVCTVDSTTGALAILAVGACTVTVTAAATDNYKAATATFGVAVNAAGALRLSVDAVAGDNTVNSAEKTAGFSIEGNTGAEADVTVTVTLGTQTFNAVTSATAAGATAATWSVPVPGGSTYVTGTTLALTVAAAKTGYTAPAAVSRTVAVDLTAPTAPAYTAPSALTVGEAITALFPAGGSDIAASNGYSAADLPAGLAIGATSGVIAGAPTTAAAAATATVTVRDGAGNTDTVAIDFPAVARGAQDLSGFNYTPASLNYGAPTPTLGAPTVADSAALSYTSTSTGVCTVDSTTGALAILAVGACTVTVTAAATDNYKAATATFGVAVNAAGALRLSVDAVAGDNTVNSAEKTAGFSIEGNTGAEADVTVTVTLGTQTFNAVTSATAAGATAATWSVPVPGGSTYVTGTTLALTVAAAKTGYTAPAAVSRTVAVDLTAPTAPAYTAPSALTVGEAITALFPAGGSDIAASNGYSAADLPAGLAIGATSGVIAGAPTTAAAAATATVTVRDGAGNTDTVAIDFPAVARGAQDLSGFNYTPASLNYGAPTPTLGAPTVADSAALSYTSTSTGVCTVDSTTGALAILAVGACTVTVTAAATDNYKAATATFGVAVNAAGALRLSVDAVAGDNTVNSAEKTAGFSIEGNTGAEADVTVTVTLGTQTFNAVTSATAAGATAATWSVPVPGGSTYVTGTTLALTVAAAKTGYTSPAAVSRTVAVDLTAPTAPAYTAPSALTVGEAITALFPAGGSDIAASNGYSAAGLPAGLAIGATSGVIAGAPTTAAAAATATVTVRDGAGNTDTVAIDFPAVARGAQDLSGFNYTPASLNYGAPTPTLGAPTVADSAALSYTSTSTGVCTVDSTTGALAILAVGACTVTVTAAATDNYKAATATFGVAVNAAGALRLSVDAVAGDNTVNSAEKTAGFSIEGNTGAEADVTVTVTLGTQTFNAVTSATAAGATAATWSVPVPGGSTYVTGTTLALTVAAAKTGYTAPAAVSRTVAVDLTAPTAPAYTAPSALTVGEAITALFPAGGSDIAASNGYSAADLPAGLAIGATSGVIAGAPTTAAGAATATVTVRDGAGNTDTVAIDFPAVARGAQDLSGFNYTPASLNYGAPTPTLGAPTVADSAALSYTSTSTGVCTVDSTTGALAILAVGACTVTVTAAATDNYKAATATFGVAVNAAGALRLSVDAVAGDNTVNSAEKTAGFSIEGNTGAEADVTVTVTLGTQTFNAVTSATAAGATAATWSVPVPGGSTYVTGTTLALTVAAAKTGYTAPAAVSRTVAVDLTAPTAPAYTAPSALTVGEAITALFPAGGSDIAASNGYSAADLPAGLAIGATSGVIAGAPTTAAGAATATVTVRDGAGNTDTVAIDFPAVAQGEQDLSGFNYTPASLNYGAPTPTLGAPTVADSAALSYTSTSTGVCTVDSTTGALAILAVGACTVTVAAAATDNYKAATATFGVAVNAAGALRLSVDAVAGDNTVNSAEKTAGFSIEGNTGAEADVTVTVTLGTQTFNAVTSATAAGATAATWSVPVPGGSTYVTGTTLALTVAAAKTGYTAPAAVSRTVAVDLTAPTAPAYTAPSALTVGEAITALFPAGGSDIAASNGYSAAGLPAGLAIGATSGVIAGAPTTAAGAATATVTVRDGAGNTDTVAIDFPAVARGAQDLSGFNYTPASLNYGAPTPTLGAPTVADSAALSYTSTSTGVCTVDSTTGALAILAVGACTVTVTAAATDNYKAATATFGVAVNAAGALRLSVDAVAGDNTVNSAEKTAGFSIEGNTGAEADVTVTVTLGTQTFNAVTSATAAGATAATWSVPVPGGSTYVTGTTLALTVAAAKTGYTAPAAVSRTVAVDLTAPTAPAYTAPSALTVGEAITALFPAGGSDIAASNGYSAADLPAGLAIGATSGVIAGAPTTAAGAATATVTVRDGAGNTDTVAIDFPAVAQGEQDLSGFNYTPASLNYGAPTPTLGAPTVADSAALSYTSTSTGVCTVDSTTGALAILAVGACTVTVTAAATDNYKAATATFGVAVNAAGALRLSVDAVAGDNTVNSAEKTAGFSIEGNTGAEADVTVTVTLGTQTFNAVTSATAAGATAATWSVPVPGGSTYVTGTTLALTVAAAKTGYTAPAAVSRTVAVDLTAPTAPAYTAPSALTVGEAITALFPAGGSDIAASNGYSAAGLPAGLAIGATSGVIAGAPTTAAGAATATVTVRDGAGNTDTVAIDFPAVARGAQDLSGFNYTPASLNYGAPTPTLGAPTVADSAALSYTSTSTGVCTVDSTTGALAILAVGACTVTVTAAATDNYKAATATFGVAVNAAGALRLSVDAVAGDNTVNSAEKTAGFSIEGNTGAEADVTVTVTLGTQTFNAVTSATAAGATAATWSVPVPGGSTYVTGTTLALTVAAAKTGYTAPAAVSRTVAVDLTAPTAPAYTAPSALTVGEAITALFPAGGSDIAASNGYSAADLPAGLAIGATSGVIAGAPTTAAAAATATVTVRDGAGNTDTVAIDFPAVARGAQDLSGFNYTPASLNYGAPTPTLGAPTVADSAALSYTSTSTGVCTVDSTTGALAILAVGACTVTVTAAATDNYKAATATFGVAVNAAGALRLSVDAVAGDNTVNSAEKTAGFSIEGNTGAEADVTVTVTLGTQTFNAVTSATAAGATAATWSVPVPGGSTYVTGTTLALTVAAAKTGYTAPAAVSRTVAVDLTAPTAPAYTAPSALTVGEAITALFPAGGSDIAASNGYSAADLPAGLAIGATSGVIAGAPTTAAAAATATVTVRDGAGNTDTVAIDFPAVARGAQDLSGFNYTPASLNYGAPTPTLGAPTVADSAALSYTSTSTGVCTVDSTTGALAILAVGACTVTVTAAATDNYKAATATFGVAVNAAGALRLSVDAVAGDNTVNSAEKTAGFSIEGNTGAEADVTVTVTLGTQTFNAVTSATAAGATAATWSVPVPGGSTYVTGTTLALTVAAAKTGYTSPAAVSRTVAVDLTAPTAPAYTAPSALTVGEAITALFPAGGSDIAASNGYSAAGLPAGLAIGATSGVIAGAPTTAAAAATATVTVRDGAGNTDTVAIDFPAVAQGEQDLSGFNYTPASLNYGAPTPTLGAPTVADSAALSYTSTSTGVCTVDSTTGALAILAVGACTVTVTAAATDNYKAATATFGVAVNAAGALRLSVDAVAGDNTVNSAEKTAGFSIEGNTGAEADVTVTVTLGTQTFNAVTSATAAGATAATWSVPVPGGSTYVTGTTLALTVAAAKTGYTAPAAVSRTVAVDLTAPTAPAYTAPSALTVGEAITALFPAGGSDIAASNGYSAADLPAGLAIGATSGVIAGAPTTAAAAATATVTVRDGAGNTDTVAIDFPAVARGAQDLSGFNYTPASLNYGAPTPTLGAPTVADSAALSYTSTSTGVCTVDSTTGALAILAVGACTVTVTAAATDNYKAATATFGVAVNAAGALRLSVDAVAGDNTVNSAEKTAGFSIEGNTGAEADVTVTVTLGTQTFNAVTSATAAGATAATWSVPVPGGSTYVTGTTLALTVAAAKTGYTAPAAVSRTVAVDLTAPTAPAYTAPSALTVGEAITALFPAGGSDIAASNGYSAAGLPAGLAIGATSGVIAGAPTTAAGAATATVTVRDGAGNTDTVAIDFPAVAQGAQDLSGFNYTPASLNYGAPTPTLGAPTVADSAALSYTSTSTGVCTVDSTTGALAILAVGACTVTVAAAATDNYKAATATFGVAVNAAGALRLSVDAVAGDNTVNSAEKTAGFSIEGNTGAEADVTVTVTLGTQTFNAVTSATAAGATAATWSVPVPGGSTYVTGTTLALTVAAAKTGYTAPAAVSRTVAVDLTAPTAPAYTAPSALTVGEAITALFPAGGSDIAASNGYSAAGLPAGLAIGATSGVIAGAPTTAAAAATATVTVRDGAGNTDTVAIDFPAVAQGAQDLSGFNYTPASLNYGAPTPTLGAPTVADSAALSYTSTSTGVCTVDSTTGALAILAVGACTVTVAAAATDNYKAATATFGVAVNAAGALRLSVDAVAGDNTVNSAEKTAGFSIEGNTGAEADVTVTVTLGTQTFNAVTSATAAGATAATWSVPVPGGSTYVTGTTLALTVAAAKTGYTAPAAVSRTVAVDLTAPTAPAYTAPSALTVGEAITALFPAGGSDIAASNGYSAAGLPAGLAIGATSGVIAGAPTTAAGAATATVTVRDGAGNTDTVAIDFPAVAQGEQDLSGFNYTPASLNYGAPTPTLGAPTVADSAALSYTSTSTGVCTVDSTTGALAILAVGACTVTVAAAATDNYKAATATFGVAVNAAGALRLSVDAVAGDNTVNSAEKTAGFSIEGNTGAEADVTVTVTLGTQTFNAVTSATAAGATAATWSVPVPGGSTYVTGTTLALTVAAAKTGYTAPAAVSRTVAVDLTAPTAPAYTAPSALTVGEAITALFPAGGSDIAASNGYSAAGLPAGLAIGATSGVIAGAPTTAAGAATATVTVRDGAGNTDTVAIDFPAVAQGEQTLTGFKYSATSVVFGGTAPTLTAPTGAVTALSYSATPASVCSVNSSSGALTLVEAGRCEITVTAAANANYKEATDTFAVTMQAAGTLALNVDSITGDDTVNSAEKAAGFTVSGDTGTETGVGVSVRIGSQSALSATSAIPTGENDATWSVSVPAAAAYLTDAAALIVTVAAAKTGFTAPTPISRTLTVDLTAPTAPGYTAPASLTVGTAIAAMSPSSTADTDIDGYSATGLPAGLGINSSGVISGTPTTAATSTAAVTVTITDTAGNPATADLTFPAVAKGEQTLTGFKYSATSVVFGGTAPTLTAPTGAVTALSYSATPASVCSVNSSSGALTLVGLGSCEITVTAAANANYKEATDRFSVTVQAAGTLALNVDSITGDDTVNSAEKTAGFTVSGDTGTETGVGVSVRIGSQPALTATSAGDGAWSVSVPPNASYITGTSVTVTVAAAKAGFTAPTPVSRTLTVDLSGPTALSYTVPSDYALTVGTAAAALSPTGGADIDSYAATGLPAGLSINSSTGVIGGTPTTANAAAAEVSVTVSDTAGNTDTTGLTFPAVAAEEIQVMINGEIFIITIIYRPAHVSVTANGLSDEMMQAQVPPEGVMFSTPPVYIDASGLLAGEHVHYCLPRGNVPAGHAATIYTAGANDGSNSSHWTAVSSQEDEPLMPRVCARAPNFSPFRVGFISTETPVRAVFLAVNVSPGRFAAQEDIITYTYTLTNDGTETLAGPASIDDDVVAGVNCEAAPAGGVEPGASLRCTGAYTVTQADVDAQRVVSRATAMLDGVSSQTIITTVLLETTNNQLPRLLVSNARAAENAGSLTFIVRLNVAAAEVVTVDYATQAMTARSVFDYSDVSGTLRFDVGESEKQVKVTLRDDDRYEEDETFRLTLSDPVNAVLIQDTATGTIIDDDRMPTLYIRHATAAEGAGELVFRVVLEPTGNLPVTVQWATWDGTAEGRADYRPSGGTLTFNPGEGRKKLRVPVIDDAINENTENLRVTLSNQVNALLGRATGTGYIYDDDVRGIRVTPQTVQVDEGSSAGFEVVLATQPVGSVTLALATDAAGSTLTPDQLHFDATNWSMPQKVAVAAPTDEDMVDADRMLMLMASGGDYVGVQTRVVLIIRDSDRPPDDLPDENPIVVPTGMPGARNEMRQ